VASEVEEVLIKIKADVNQATSEIKKIQESLDKTEKSTTNTMKSILNWAKGVGVLMAVKEAFSYVSKETIASEKAVAQLNAVLSSTSYAAGLSAQEIQKMAENMSELTAIDDEVIMSGQSLLLTFTKIGRDVFPQATEAMLDMSVALGQDVSNSAIQLGKALNDPIQGAIALRRVGVQLTDEQQNQIKSFMALGDVVSAQKVILEELNTEFGGSAAAQLQTYGGQLNSLAISAGNFAAAIGDWMGLKDIMHGVRVALDGLTLSGQEWTEKHAAIKNPLDFVNQGASKGIKEGGRKSPTGGGSSDLQKQAYEEAIKQRQEYESYMDKMDGGRVFAEDTKYQKMKEYAIAHHLSIEELTAQHQANLEEIERQSLEKRTQQFEGYTNSIAGFATTMCSQLSSVFSMQANNEIATSQRKYKRNQFIIGATIKDEDKKKKALQLLEIKQELFEMQVKRREFERNKGMQIATASISMMTGAVMAFQSMLCIPIVGVILGAIAAAAVLAFGAAQIAMIAQTRAPMMAEGGLIRGTQSGTSIIAGEGGRSEAIIPLENPEAMSKLGGMGGVTYNISLDGAMFADQDMPEKVAEWIDRALYKLDRRRNSLFAGAVRA
jgi:hypothetical protein